MKRICKTCKTNRAVYEYDTTKGAKRPSRMYYCIGCERERQAGRKEYYKVYNRARRVEANEYQKKHNRKAREKFLELYGGQCECCNEKQYEFLALDHIQNDAKANGKRRSSTIQYKEAVRTMDKTRFRILCHNCNLARAFYGICPHQTLPSQPVE